MAVMGRPSGFSQELGDRICERIADGESVRSICRDEGMPSQSMVFRWIAQDEVFRRQYVAAREAQADLLADETLEIADEATNDWMEANDKDNAGWRFNGEAVARSRLRVDARKWFASKMFPKKYGDRLQAEVSGPDGGPIEHTHRVSDATRGLLEDLSRIGTDRGAAPPVPD